MQENLLSAERKVFDAKETFTFQKMGRDERRIFNFNN